MRPYLAAPALSRSYQQQTQIELLTRLVAERGLAGPEMPN